jgi:tRNA threonylcarbamoyladenosine biosynthesis protein TsaB
MGPEAGVAVMLMLCLRSDKPEAELYLYDGREKLQELRWEAHRQLAETLHIKIEGLLALQGLTLEKLEKVCVYQGPGSFTGLRIGLSVANTLAYSLGIPVVGAEGEDWLELCLAQEAVSYSPVVPMYGSEPNITKPKK